MSNPPSSDPVFDQLGAALAGEYRLERELGRGGMGVVYLAHDARLDRPVAIKVLPPLGADPGTRERFVREARSAARVSHPNIVPIYRAAEIEGLPYFVMAYIEGFSLEERLGPGGVLGARDGIPMLREAALALGHAHAAGVVHRDVKPANMLIERRTGRVLLTDFGIAHAATSDHGPPLTHTGTVLGTVQYMSPEQASGGADRWAERPVFVRRCRVPYAERTPAVRWSACSRPRRARLAACPAASGLRARRLGATRRRHRTVSGEGPSCPVCNRGGARPSP